MSLELQIPVSPAGMLVAVACVVAGGPVFSDGMRALRLRRLLPRLRERPLDPSCSGIVHVRGRVALESPLFSPLSGKPCAGFTLEAFGQGAYGGGVARELRPFRLLSGATTARVDALGGDWRLPVTAERTYAADEMPSANVSALLERTPELRWLKRMRAPLRLVERALVAGTSAYVVGVAQAGPVSLATELQRTGTDNAVTTEAAENVPSLTIGGSDPLDLVVVSDRAPEPARLAPPAWRTLGVALGPALTLAGLLYLARAAEGTLVGRV